MPSLKILFCRISDNSCDANIKIYQQVWNVVLIDGDNNPFRWYRQSLKRFIGRQKKSTAQSFTINIFTYGNKTLVIILRYLEDLKVLFSILFYSLSIPLFRSCHFAHRNVQVTFWTSPSTQAVRFIRTIWPNFKGTK